MVMMMIDGDDDDHVGDASGRGQLVPPRSISLRGLGRGPRRMMIMLVMIVMMIMMTCL